MWIHEQKEKPSGPSFFSSLYFTLAGGQQGEYKLEKKRKKKMCSKELFPELC